ncbi:hypothetical protein JB92DRAFT_2743813 [Gautieria morchelliformis]|nr:hypothetical protein JB92DRAFT_2743813 [Gautieria morchelliformis]
MSSSSAVPGVQKIKSSLRQTRRLLAKDNLAADVRIETERRLRSLESDLAKAERTRQERTLAVKYHKVKFFERQKVCRKIKHAKKELDGTNVSPENLSSLRESLFSHRVDLNYILVRHFRLNGHYPKTRKYISLFPQEAAKVDSGAGSSDTDKQRSELRRLVREAMEKGKMDAEPEVTMDKRRSQEEAMEWQEASEPPAGVERKGKRKEVVASKLKGVPGDAFFEASESDDQGQSDDG